MEKLFLFRLFWNKLIRKRKRGWWQKLLVAVGLKRNSIELVKAASAAFATSTYATLQKLKLVIIIIMFIVTATNYRPVEVFLTSFHLLEKVEINSVLHRNKEKCRSSANKVTFTIVGNIIIKSLNLLGHWTFLLDILLLLLLLLHL